MEDFIKLLKEAKAICEKTECEKCPLSVGIYQRGLDYTYYMCDIRRKPRDWDLEKDRKKTKDEKPKKKRKRKKKED